MLSYFFLTCLCICESYLSRFFGYSTQKTNSAFSWTAKSLIFFLPKHLINLNNLQKHFSAKCGTLSEDDCVETENFLMVLRLRVSITRHRDRNSKPPRTLKQAWRKKNPPACRSSSRRVCIRSAWSENTFLFCRGGVLQKAAPHLGQRGVFNNAFFLHCSPLPPTSSCSKGLLQELWLCTNKKISRAWKKQQTV